MRPQTTLTGHSYRTFSEVDTALIELHGTDTKSRLGANAITGVSLAAARAQALTDGAELWQHFAAAASAQSLLPVPHFNVVNGGAHAANDLDFQEFMLAPHRRPQPAGGSTRRRRIGAPTMVPTITNSQLTPSSPRPRTG